MATGTFAGDFRDWTTIRRMDRRSAGRTDPPAAVADEADHERLRSRRMTLAAATPTRTPVDLELIDRYWRAANYLSVGQIYLLDNPLLREPLRPSTSSPGCSAIGGRRRG